MRLFDRNITANYFLHYLRRLLFSEKVIYQASSPINGMISVHDRGWERVLRLEGETHSVYYKYFGWGEARRDYWGLLASPVLCRTGGADILMLGLGGGTTLHLMHRLAPPASVTVVELDPDVISVADSYFGVGSIPHLTVIRGDALTEMRRMQVDGKLFDILMDDVFFNMTRVDTDPGMEIFSVMKSLLRPGGVLIFNRPVDDPGDMEKHSLFIRQLQTPGADLEVRTVRGRWWNEIIYYRSRTS